MISGKTKVVVHLSHPSDHLRTPGLFNPRARKLGHDIVLVPWDVAPADLAQAWEGLRRINNLAGVVVTIPHKEAVARLCDDLEPEARAMGVCNVARRAPDGRFHGAMFDGVGFVAGLRAEGHDVTGKSVLLVGAGGAATAIAHAIARQCPACLRISNRTKEKAETLVAALRQRFTGLDVAASGPDASGMNFVINGTSIGMHEGDPLPVNIATIAADSVVAEVVMQPDHTRLLQHARARGALIHRGVHMINHQIDLLIDYLSKS